MPSPALALASIVRQLSEDALMGDADRVRELLTRELPGDAYTAELLTRAVEFGVLRDLIDPAAWAPFIDVRADLANRLEQHGIGAADAEWVVDSWGSALGLTDADPGERPVVRPPVQEWIDPEAPVVDSRKPAPTPTPTPTPTPVVELSRPAPRRRRLTLMAAVGIVAIAVASATIGALLPHAKGGLSIGGPGTATSTQGGGLGEGELVRPGTRLSVTSGPFELTLGSSAMRFATGARLSLTGANAVLLDDGRAFVNAGADTVVVETAQGSTTVRHGRAFVSCASGACTTTAIDGDVTVRQPGRSVSLAAEHVLTSAGAPSPLLADAIRLDPWFVSNDRLDSSEHRARPAVPGPRLVGTWDVSLHRPDLPLDLVRPVVFTSRCGATGCVIMASTSFSDNVSLDPVQGTVRRAPGATRLTVDYGNHRARCEWLPGTPKGGGIDGRETATDSFTISSNGTRIAGTRTTQYTPVGKHCDSAADREVKSAALAGSRKAPSSSLTEHDQQALLNYIASSGDGCVAATGAPTAALSSDLRCSYPSAPATVELGVYVTSAALRAAYTASVTSYGLHGSGICSSGPCEGVAPNGHGRMMLSRTGGGAVLITYDPRASNLLLLVHGTSTAELSAWWNDQQATHSTYSASPIPRVGV